MGSSLITLVKSNPGQCKWGVKVWKERFYCTVKLKALKICPIFNCQHALYKVSSTIKLHIQPFSFVLLQFSCDLLQQLAHTICVSFQIRLREIRLRKM